MSPAPPPALGGAAVLLTGGSGGLGRALCDGIGSGARDLPPDAFNALDTA